MNTLSIQSDRFFDQKRTGPGGPAVTPHRHLGVAARSVAAITAGLVFLAAATWAITTPGVAMYLQALTWLTSFVFFAVSLETQKSSTALLALATGIALMAVAALSVSCGVNMIFFGALLMAAWLLSAIWQKGSWGRQKG